jgi:hypothetical protein
VWTWTEIDRHTDNQDFKYGHRHGYGYGCSNTAASFTVSNQAEFRFIRPVGLIRPNTGQ